MYYTLLIDKSFVNYEFVAIAFNISTYKKREL